VISRINDLSVQIASMIRDGPIGDGMPHTVSEVSFQEEKKSESSGDFSKQSKGVNGAILLP